MGKGNLKENKSVYNIFCGYEHTYKLLWNTYQVMNSLVLILQEKAGSWEKVLRKVWGFGFCIFRKGNQQTKS